MNDTPPEEDANQAELPVSEAATDPAALTRLEHILEALLLASDSPLSLEQLSRLLGPELGATKKDLRAALDQLAERVAHGATELREVGSGFRLQVKADYAEWVGRLWQEKPPKYSRALLETLALICYRQPITRGEIEDVRGVAVSTNILRTLLERGWIRELGVREVPGRPALFGTTHQFLDDFNLRSLDQLPSLPEIKDLDQLDVALARLGAAAEQAVAGAAAEAEDEAAAVTDAPATESAAPDDVPNNTRLH
jgi:segregation and condensation protein B